MRRTVLRSTACVLKPMFTPPVQADLPSEVSSAFFKYCEALDKKHPFRMDRFLPTPIKAEILQQVESKAASLSAWDFREDVGGQSCLVVGEQGIGKSNTLKRAVLLTAARHANVIPIYVEYSQADASERKWSPSSLIVTALQERGVELPPAGTPLQGILEHLENKDVFVLLVADEFDQLFLFNEDDAEALRTVREYSALGCSAMGRVSPILCGSSGNLPLLISGKGRCDETLAQAYPLSKRTPDLNGTKYEAVHLPDPRFSLDVFNLVMDHYFPACDGSQRRLIYFLCGTNLRRLSKMKKTTTNGATFSFCRDQWGIRGSRTLDYHKSLIAELDLRLFELNDHLLCGVRSAQTFKELYTAICKVDWMTEVVPIREDELREIWNKHHKTAADIQHLVDKGWFSCAPGLKKLYPATGAFLLIGSDVIKDTPLSRLKKTLSHEEVLRTLVITALEGAGSVGRMFS